MLFVLSQLLNIFDLKGSTAALFVGLIVVFTASLTWLVLMLVFAVTSHIATKAWIDEKKAKHVQEGLTGERGSSNVLYAALIGIAISSLNYFHPISLPYFELFAISFAVVNADTFASEIGVLDKNVYLITTFKRVRPGVNGGVSLLGQISALVGGFIISISYSLLAFDGIRIIPILLVGIMGFVGCQIDSILGAVFENKDKLSKGEVNLLSSLFTVILSAAIIF